MIQCPQCGQLNEPFFKFCLMCGDTLTGGVTVEQKPTRPVEAPKAAPAVVAPKAAVALKAQPVVSPAVEAVSDAPAQALAEAAPQADAGSQAPEEAVSAEPAVAQPEPSVSEPEPSVSEPEPSVSEPEPPVSEPEPPVSEPEPPVSEPEWAEAPRVSAMPVSGPDDDEELGESVSARPAEAKPASQAGRRRTRFTLVVIRDDATDGEKVALDEGIFTVGREGADLEFADDVYMDELHASLQVTASAVTVLDQGTVNGVFTQVHTAAPLSSGGEIRLGQQLLRYEDIDAVGSIAPSPDGSELLGAPLPAAVWGRLVEVVGPDFDSAAYLLEGSSVTLGRDRGDITFPDDGYVSGRHARLLREGNSTLVEDLGSSNGTYVRTHGPTPLKAGVMLLMGQQLFRLDG